MGQPEHYSADIPERCLHLIEKLLPRAEQIFMPGQHKDLGPLVSTFVLTMSIPVITLPYERIFKPDDSEFSYADDRHVRTNLSFEVKSQMNLPKLSESRFFGLDWWRFTKVGENSLFNLADGIPDHVADALSIEKARQDASNMPVTQWISIIRNALSHGGIAYLDESGRSSYGHRVAMFAFASGKYDRGNTPHRLVGLNVLRISQSDFEDFLREWVRWLQISGIDLRAAA